MRGIEIRAGDFSKEIFYRIERGFSYLLSNINISEAGCSS